LEKVEPNLPFHLSKSTFSTFKKGGAKSTFRNQPLEKVEPNLPFHLSKSTFGKG
jgi:hypothetical protein